ncbi:MAG: prolipoprotein diacylglyceryl transferase [Holosporales bacterium]|jgi:phosphatidylglycerol:prolipoprotein diacylglycerol transferase|nr:prolipoprotein diacylglyceryl transferase [Holosporales bacterium]
MFDASSISPIAFSILGVSIHWYGVSYVVSLWIALWYSKRLQVRFFKEEDNRLLSKSISSSKVEGVPEAQNRSVLDIHEGGHWGKSQISPKPHEDSSLKATNKFAEEIELRKKSIDSFFVLACIAIVIGGRLGHILFFDPHFYFSNPIQILDFRSGGMAFHGGLIGMIIALWLFCKAKKKNIWQFADIIATVAPIGLGIGRLANFVNNELYGKPTQSFLGVIFRGAENPRHPTQIYEAIGEGLLTFIILRLCWRVRFCREVHGIIFALFLINYAFFRIIIDFLKESDVFLMLTIGQWLSLIMLLCGFGIIMFKKK